MYYYQCVNLVGPRGGMVDTRDLKSLGLIIRAGSSPAVGTRFQLNFPLKHSISRLSFQKGNSKWVKKELIRVKTGRACMTKNKDESDTLNEEVEILNLPLYTERKADGIYRYRRRVPKSLTKRVGKGYLYRNLGRAKDEVVANWPVAHTEIEQIIQAAQQGAENAQELVRKKDHRTMVLHLVEEHFGKQTAELLEAGKVDDDLEHALMDLSDSLEGQYPKKTLAMMYGGVLPEKQNTLAEVLEVYLDYKETGYAATDHRLRVRLDKCKADLIEALGSAKVEKLSVKDIKRQDANAYRDLLLSRMSANSVARYKNTINAAMNWYIKENALDMLSPFAGLLIKGAGASKTDRLPLTDDHLKQLAPQFEDSDAACALCVTLRDTDARSA